MANQYTKKNAAKVKKKTGDGFIRNNAEGRKLMGEHFAEALENALPRMVHVVANIPSETPLMNKADEKAKSVPHFTLLPNDNFTPILVKHWIRFALDHGVNETKILEAKAVLKNIEQWRTNNPTSCKTPD